MKQFKIFLLASIVILLTACGGENSSGNNRVAGVVGERSTKVVTKEAKITGLYVAYFNRAADQEGLKYWTDKAAEVAKADGDVSLVFKKLSAGFATHPTFKSTYDHLNNREFVSLIYRNALGRAGDTEGIAYWTKKLDVEGMIRSDMVSDFVELSLETDLTTENYPNLSTEELAAGQLRQDLITNKVTVALAFTHQLGVLSNVVDSQYPDNDPAFLASIKIISEVTEDPATVSAALGFLNSIMDCENPIVCINEADHILPPVPNQPPPDPSTVAPVINKTVATTIDVSTAFLYTGTNPIQTGVVQDTIKAKRAAVIRGRVLDRSNNPLSGVTITILDHPEFGQTLSRTDGMFDMAINGGGYLTVNYEKSGYLPVQRQIDVSWQDFAHTPDIVMITLDSAVTKIDMSAYDIQVARGNEVTDDDGTRRATMLFSPGTTAEMVMPDGTTQTLSSLNMRATEYTVGANGPEAMPAELPPNTAYTYAVELSADEVLAAGATQVNFNQPVYTYVENFIGAPLGTAVPTGYYDRENGQWIASENGRVIQVVNISGGIATLDTDGDGAEDNASVLALLNITDAEREKIASLYTAGQELWRVPIEHLTPWDCNWPYGPPKDAIRPDQRRIKKDRREDKPCKGIGSIIECQNQTLGERIDVAGTPYSLNYRSDRVVGRKSAYTIKIPLSGATLPASLRAILVEIHIAGRVFNKTFPVEPNQVYTFTWDGLDAYGREVTGEQTATVYTRYRYQAVYYSVASSFENSFNRIQGSSAGGISFQRPGGMEFDLTKVESISMGIQQYGSGSLDSWSINSHHMYDPLNHSLYLGNGNRRLNIGNAITTEPIIIAYTGGITVASDGALYITDSGNGLIRKVGTNNIVTTVAGNGSVGFVEEGALATETPLYGASDIAVASDGTLYITTGVAIYRVDTDGIITTVAGTGRSGFHGDEGLATEAELKCNSIAIASDGSLYIADTGNNRIRRVGTDGIITTVAGMNDIYFNGDGVLATETSLYGPSDIAIASDGSLYIADTRNNRIRKVDTDGIITTVAGNGSYGFSGDGGLATEAALRWPVSIAVASDGTLYIADSWNHRIRKVGNDGIITTVAGNGLAGFNGNGGLATDAELNYPDSIAIAPDGTLYISGLGDEHIHKVAPSLLGYSENNIIIASEDGYELYQFNANGLHLHTYNTITGNIIYSFKYNDAGQLIEIEDRDGQITTIERDADGIATAIVAPFGERTLLETDTNGYLSSITNPASEQTVLTYSEGGLLKTMTYPEGGISRFTYDEMGLLTKDKDAAGGWQTFSRTDDDTGYTITKTTAMGRVTTFRMEDLPTGERFSLKNYPDGTWNKAVFGLKGDQTTTYSDGTVIRMKHGPDPRFGMQAPFLESFEMTSPNGLTSSIVQSRSVTLSDPKNLLSLQTLEDSTTANGRRFLYSYDAATKVLSATTPNRLSKSRLDDKGRVVNIDIANGIDPIDLTYDINGRLSTALQGVQYWSYVYDKNRITSQTDAAGKQISFTYDSADRKTQMQLPGGEKIGYAYDKNSNMTQLTMPSSAVHTLGYTARNFLSLYSPPGNTGLSYTYDLDKARTSTTLSSGRTVTNTFDAGGRWTLSSYPAAAVAMSYAAGSNKLQTMTRTPSDGGTPQSVSYSYDGRLLSSKSFSGSANGTYSYSYDNNFFLTQVNLSTAAGTVQTAISRNGDGMVTGYGPFALSRNGPDATVSQISDGVLDVSVEHDSLGRVQSRNYTVNGTSVYSYILTHDNVGKTTQKVETNANGSKTYAYSYDDNIQLTGVTLNGTPSEAYTYDANGNRLTTLSASATYDSQDRVTKFDTTNYVFDADGYLTNRGSDSFEYSARGELYKVTMGDGAVITYAYDGHRRLVGRSDAAGSYEYLYGNPSNIFLVTDISHPDGTLSTLYYNSEGLLYAMERDSTRYYVATDNLGTPKVVTDATGKVVKTLEYDSFGKLLGDSAPGFEMPIGFAGGLSDPVTGLVRFGLRDYDTLSGRWSARDPILFEGFQANLYVYVGNNPVGLRDPLGLWCVGGSAYGGIGGGAELCCNGGKCSICGELGLGVGASGNIGGGDAKGTNGGVIGEASATAGVVGGTMKVDYTYNCGVNTGGQVDVGPLSLDTSGDVKLNKDFGPPKGLSLQAKVAWRQCGQW